MTQELCLRSIRKVVEGGSPDWMLLALETASQSAIVNPDSVGPHRRNRGFGARASTGPNRQQSLVTRCAAISRLQEAHDQRPCDMD